MRQPFDIFGLNCSARFFDLTHLLICLICSLSWFDPFCFPGLTSSLFRSHQLALLRITHRQTDRHTHAPSHHTHTHTHTHTKQQQQQKSQTFGTNAVFKRVMPGVHLVSVAIFCLQTGSPCWTEALTPSTVTRNCPGNVAMTSRPTA